MTQTYTVGFGCIKGSDKGMVVDLPVCGYPVWHISNKLYLKPLWMQRGLKLRDQTHIPGMTTTFLGTG